MSSPDSPSLEINRHVKIEIAVVVSALSILFCVPLMLAYLLPTFSWRWAIVLSILSVAIATMHCWWLGWLGNNRAITKARWGSDGQWLLFDITGAQWPATLRHDSYLFGALCGLRFDSERGRRQILLITPGFNFARHTERESQGGSEARRLRVRLRLHAAAVRSHARAIEANDAAETVAPTRWLAALKLVGIHKS